MKAYKYLLIGALMLGSSVPTFAQNDNKAVIEQGTKVILAKGADYKDQVKQLYKDNKKNPEVLVAFGKVFLAQKDTANAKAFANYALARNPKYAKAFLLKGDIAVSSFADGELKGLEESALQAHVDRTRDIFARAANRTNGVLTYYYRIDPAVSDTVKGFWYTNLDGEGFTEHQVTDITLYDTEDTSALVWFTVPKATGKAIWLPPYVTDNLDVLVLSYNVPIYWQGTFVGVIGIEIDYSTMAGLVDNIRPYTSGYAFINDSEGIILFTTLLTGWRSRRPGCR